MRIVTGAKAFRHPPARAVVTVGVFDGVHIAHQRLITATVRLARRLRGTSLVITFDPDPQAVLHPGSAPPALMPMDARCRIMRAFGVDCIWIIPFTRRFARMQAERFIREILLSRVRARALIVGEEFAFGRDRQGDMAILRRLGPPMGMRIVPIRSMTRARAPVSSSRIRRLIQNGNLGAAGRLLGRPPALYGTVVSGAGRGRRLGIPTANIRLIPQVVPPYGVYAVILHASRRRWPGVMNLGVRPTFGPGPTVCEIHLLGFAGSLTGRRVSVLLLAKLRGERRFHTPEALQRQVHRDIAKARRFLQKVSDTS